MNETNTNQNPSNINLLDLVSYNSKDYKLMNGIEKKVDGIVLGIIRGMNKPFSLEDNYLELQSEVNGEYYYDIIKANYVSALETANFYTRYPGANFLLGWPTNNIILDVNDIHDRRIQQGVIISTQINVGLDKLSIKLYDLNNIFDTIEILEYAAYAKFFKEIKNTGFDSRLLLENIKNNYVRNEILAFLNKEKYHDTIRPHKDYKIFLIEENLDDLR